MIKTYEILNDGAFVVTKDTDNRILVGYYHDVYNNGSCERIFEPIAPLDVLTPEDLIRYIQVAE